MKTLHRNVSVFLHHTYTRAEIRIMDRKGLEKRACECYRIIKQHLDDFVAFDTDDTK